MFTPKRSLLVVFVIAAIGLDLTAAANIRGFGDIVELPNTYDAPPGSSQAQSSSPNAQPFKLRGPILSAVMLIILILGQILVCFENKNCQRAAVILNYLSTGVMVLMLYFLYIDISAHMT
eukprot:27788_1